MNEVQWQSCDTNTNGMLNALGATAGDRRLRLFAVACVRHILPQISNANRSEIERLVTIAERYADGQSSPAEQEAARRVKNPWRWEITAAAELCHPDARVAAGRTSDAVAELARELWLEVHRSVRHDSFEALGIIRAAREYQTALIRCIFGNPFHPVQVAAAWRTETVLALVRGIRAEWALDRLPILADALEDAGCDEAALLNHLRGSGPHARACWVLDAITECADSGERLPE